MNNKNQFNNCRYDEEKKEILCENLIATNTYPVFLKLEQDLNLEQPTPLTFALKDKYEPFKIYLARANNIIINFIKAVYTKYSKINTNAHRILQQHKDGSLEQIIDNQFRLLFLKTNNLVIFLNYTLLNQEKYSYINSNYIADFRKNRNAHVRPMEKNNIKYLVINTFEPFLSFGRLHNINKENVNKKLNIPFFESFERSFIEPKQSHITVINCGELNNGLIDTGRSFDYCILKGVIIITNYYERTIEDELEFGYHV